MSSLQNNNSQNEISIYTFETKQFRVVGTSENPRFVVKDICDILDISNPTMAVRSIPEEWRGDLNQIEDSFGHKQHMLTVYEPGLYHLIMRSDKPVAKQFQKWTFEEVLPSIRKKGEYVLEEYKKKLEEQQKLLEEKETKFKEILDEKESEFVKQNEQLEKKDKHIKKLQREKQVVEGHNCVYLCTAEGKEEEGIYTIGQTTDIGRRLNDYNNNKLFQFKMAKYISCKSFKLMDAIETILLAKLNHYKIVRNRDVFQLPEGKDETFFTQWYDYIAKFCEDIEEGIELEERTPEEQQELLDERQSVYLKEYYSENKEKILEKNKEYREKNAEVISELKKRYQVENKDVIFETRKQYREENKEVIAEKKKKYAEENKEVIAVKQKKYYAEHKEKILENVKQYREENKEKITDKNKKRYEENKEEILEQKKKYAEENKERLAEYHKQYYEENKKIASEYGKQRYKEKKEEIKEKSQKYYHNPENKEKMKERDLKRYSKDKEITVECECGRNVTKLRISYHKKTKIHKAALELKTRNLISSVQTAAKPVQSEIKREITVKTRSSISNETLAPVQKKEPKKVEKVLCECGKFIAKPSIFQHKKSKMHDIALKLKNGSEEIVN